MSDVGKKIIKSLKELVEVSPTLRDFEVLAKLREAFPHYIVRLQLDDKQSFTAKVFLPSDPAITVTSPVIALDASCREQLTNRLDAAICEMQEGLLALAMKSPTPLLFPDVIHIITRVIAASPFVPTGEYTTTPAAGTWLLDEEAFMPTRAQHGAKGFVLKRTE